MIYLKFFNENVKYENVIKIGDDIFLCSNKNKLPDGLIVKTSFYSKKGIHYGEIGIFATECDTDLPNEDYGDSVAFIYIGDKSKIITIDSSESIMNEMDAFNIENSYLKNKYNVNTYGEFCELDHNILFGRNLNFKSSIFHYEIQREVIRLLKEKYGSFDVLEILNEDFDTEPHQYIILNNNKYKI